MDQFELPRDLDRRSFFGKRPGRFSDSPNRRRAGGHAVEGEADTVEVRQAELGKKLGVGDDPRIVVEVEPNARHPYWRHRVSQHDLWPGL